MHAGWGVNSFVVKSRGDGSSPTLECADCSVAVIRMQCVHCECFVGIVEEEGGKSSPRSVQGENPPHQCTGTQLCATPLLRNSLDAQRSAFKKTAVQKFRKLRHRNPENCDAEIQKTAGAKTIMKPEIRLCPL